MKRVYYRNWDELPAVLTLEMVALIFQKTYECVRKWAANGKIPASRTPDGWLVDKEALRAWLRVNGNAAMQQVAS